MSKSTLFLGLALALCGCGREPDVSEPEAYKAYDGYVPPPQNVLAFANARVETQECVERTLPSPWKLGTVDVRLVGDPPDWTDAGVEGVTSFYASSIEVGARPANLNSSMQAFAGGIITKKPEGGWPDFTYYPVARLEVNMASGRPPKPDIHEAHTPPDAALKPDHAPIAADAFKPFELYGQEDAILILPDRTTVCVERVPGLMAGGGEGAIVYCEVRPAGETWGVIYQFPAGDPAILPSLHEQIMDFASELAACSQRRPLALSK